MLVESIGGTETLKAARAEGQMLGRWRRYATMSAGTQERMRQLTAVAVNLASVSQQMISVGLLIGGFYRFQMGEMTMGAIIAIIMLSGRSLQPVGQLAFLFTRGKQAFATLDSIETMMQVQDERQGSMRSILPEIRAGHVELRDITFRYPQASRDSLTGISLKIEPGERIGIIGKVASGKSTLGRVMCGLYEPTSGEMLIDGLDSRQYHPHQLRQDFRFVAQDAEVFSGTVRDNLVLGASDADDAQLSMRSFARAPTSSCRATPPASTFRSESGDRACRAVSARCWSSPVPSSAPASCCSSTSRPDRWTRRPSNISSTVSKRHSAQNRLSLSRPIAITCSRSSTG